MKHLNIAFTHQRVTDFKQATNFTWTVRRLDSPALAHGAINRAYVLRKFALVRRASRKYEEKHNVVAFIVTNARKWQTKVIRRYISMILKPDFPSIQYDGNYITISGLDEMTMFHLKYS